MKKDTEQHVYVGLVPLWWWAVSPFYHPCNGRDWCDRKPQRRRVRQSRAVLAAMLGAIGGF